MKDNKSVIVVAFGTYLLAALSGEDLPGYGKPGAITSEDIKEIAKKINNKLGEKKTKELKNLGNKNPFNLHHHALTVHGPADGVKSNMS